MIITSIAILVNLNGVVKKQVPTVPFLSIKVKHALVMPDQLSLCGQQKKYCVIRNKLLAN